MQLEFNIELTSKWDTIDHYDIKVDDKLIDKQVEMFANRAGYMTRRKNWPRKRDMPKGDLRELDEKGNTLKVVSPWKVL